MNLAELNANLNPNVPVGIPKIKPSQRGRWEGDSYNTYSHLDKLLHI